MSTKRENPWIISYSAGAISTGLGTVGTCVYNTGGIPLDRWRLLAAQDLKSAVPLNNLLKTVFASPQAAFVGGSARIGQKILTTVCNLYVPADFRAENPFLANFALGIGLSPLFNVPRLMQFGKVSGSSYPTTIKTYFTNIAGLKSYAHNTVIYGPGEGVRMAMCFGIKDYLGNILGGRVDPDTVENPIAHAGRMAAIAGPVVAFIETSVVVTTESVSAVQAHLKVQEAKALAAGTVIHQEPLMTTLRSTITPKYMARCWTSLFAKNVYNNTIIFWFMYAADFYCDLRAKREEEGELF